MNTSNLSVLIQGPVYGKLAIDCKKVISSVRRLLPRSQVVLSTWYETETGGNTDEYISQVKGLGVDKVVYSIDPGGPVHDPVDLTPISLARMSVGLKAGVLACDGEMTLKLRTDTPLTSIGFMDPHWTSVFGARDSNYSVFSKKIILPSQFTRDYYPGGRPDFVRYPAIMHISDWSHYGKTIDLARLYSFPVPEDLKDFAMYMLERNVFTMHEKYAPFWRRAYFRFPPECWMGMHSVGYQHFARLDSWLDYDTASTMKPMADSFLLSNFICINHVDYGITSLKHPYYVDPAQMHYDTLSSIMLTTDYANKYTKEFGCSLSRLNPEKVNPVEFGIITRRSIYGSLALCGAGDASTAVPRDFYIAADEEKLHLRRKVAEYYVQVKKLEEYIKANSIEPLRAKKVRLDDSTYSIRYEFDDREYLF